MTITPATHAISINPATGEQLSVLPWAGVDDIENALQLAAAGFRDWREANIDYRAEKLRDIGKALRARSEEMAQMITREMGKPINQARAEVAKSANLCDWYAEHGPAMLKAEPTLVENQQAVIEYRPLGTILAIMPWNFPLWQVMRGAVPIILAGNGYLLKHAPNVMGCAQLIAQVFKDAGIQMRKQFVVVGQPLQRGISKNQIECLFRLPVADICFHKQAVWQSTARFSNHRRR